MNASHGRPSVLLPYSADELTGLPPGIDVLVWDGVNATPPPSALDRVEFFVLPYLHTATAIPLMDHMPHLKVVQALTAGVEDIAPTVRRNVTLCNARGVHSTSVAELALTLTLSSLRGIPAFVRHQDAGKWDTTWRPALADRTVLILGYGSIGQAVEDRLTAFECEVIRVARSAREVHRGRVHDGSRLPDLLPRADVVIVALPLTDDTRGLLGADLLGRMKDGALLVNVGRGAIVDTEALLVELRGRRLRAALDVTDPEPLPSGHPLWQAPGVLVSPHVGGVSSAFGPRAQQLVIEQLTRYVSDDSLLNVVVRGR